MFITVQAHEYEQYDNLLLSMHRLRKTVFFDAMKWDVPVNGDFERDRYDDHRPVYLLWCSDDRSALYGSIRLMPTIGPTLLHDVFARTIPDTVDLAAPGIWEATRCCVDAAALASGHPEIDQGRAFGYLCLAAIEVAYAHGIYTLVSNYEPHMARVYSRAGLQVQELGRADGYGRRPVCCGTFDITEDVILRMRKALGLNHPLFTRRLIQQHPTGLAA